MKSKNTVPYFLKGGGEMGELIRNRDWDKTPMGHPDDWPQSLRTMVSVMLDNPFGMYIAWGKEYTQIYNDGYRPILGATKHPQALGISSKETFSEIWHIIESMFDGVMNGIPVGFPDFKLELNRNGFLETCYFDFAYSPIRMNNGEVGGVLVTVIETTNKKNAEIELKESKNELHFAIEAAQLGTFDYNPLTNKFSANDRLKKWFGLSPDDHIDLSDAIEAVVEVDRAKLTGAIQEALDYSSGGNYDVEYTIINPISKKEIIIHAKGRAWFNENNVAYRLNGTLADVTEQVTTRQNIAQSESNLKLMILQAPVAISIFRGSTYKVEIANNHALELWGRTEEEVLGKSIFSSMPELETQGIRELLDGVVETGIRFSTSELEVQLVRNGVMETVYVNFSYEPLFNEDGIINGIMAIGFDVTSQVTARKEVEDSEKRYNLMLMQSPFAFMILKGMDMVVQLANESMKEVLGKGSDIEGKPLLEVLPEIKDQAFPELLQKVYSTGMPYSANEMLAKLTRNGKLEDVYFNYVYQPYYEADNTISGVAVIAYDVTFTVLANKQIELSEKRFRNLITQAVHPILIFKGEDLILEMANEPLFELWNVDKDVLGKPFLEILPELKAQQIEDLLLDVLKNGVTHVGNEQPVTFNRPNGEAYTSYFNFVYLPLKEN
ncbi:MAG: PAS domain-containing protein, partial [Flavobacteriales bacterium]